MDQDQPPLIDESTSDAATRSLVDDVKRLVEDGRTLAEAELAYQKARAAVVGEAAKGIAAWGALALALVFFTLMALVMGLLLALATTPLGPWGALAVVTLALLFAAALCGWLAVSRAKRVSRLVSERTGSEDEPA